MSIGDSTTQELDQRLAASREIRRRFEGQWFINLSFFLGYQWVEFDGRSLWEPDLEPWQVKIVDNRIQPAVRVDIAKMTKSRPVFVGVPRTSDEEAIGAARLAEANMDYQWDQLDLQRKLRAALSWSRMCSAGFWKVCWDSSKGRQMTVMADAQGATLKNQNGGLVLPAHVANMDPSTLADGIKEKQIPLGDISVEVRSPFQMFVDPLCNEEGLENAEWIGEESVQSQTYVADRYGKDIGADTDFQAGTMEAMLPAGIGQRGAQTYRGVKVREYWAQPSSENPQGKHVVWAGGQVLLEEGNPYPKLPYVMFRATPVPGRFWPDATVTPLISPQTELNKRKSQIAENAQRIGNPPLLIPEGNDYEYSGLAGGELRYQVTGSPADVPSFLVPPEMPGYIREDIARIESSIQEISGQHDISHGAVPAGVTAASAINLLQEADDTRLGPDIQDMERSLADAGRRITWLTQHYYTDERMLRISGEDGGWDIVSFKGKSLDGNEDIGVQAGSALPRSKAAKQAAIQDVLNLMLQYGQPPKDRDMRRAFEAYDVGGLDRLFADLGEDERQIQRENMKMTNGVVVEINSYDNDAAHIDGHEQFQKSAAYDRLDDSVKAIFEAHVDAHRQRLTPPPGTIPMGPDGPPPPPPTQTGAPSGPPPSVQSPPPAPPTQ